MPLLKKALGLSIIGITIVILAMSYYIKRKELNPEWNNAITLQWIDSNEVPISELNNQSLNDLFEDFPEWSLNYEFQELNGLTLYEVFEQNANISNMTSLTDFVHYNVIQYDGYIKLNSLINENSYLLTNSSLQNNITVGDKVYINLDININQGSLRISHRSSIFLITQLGRHNASNIFIQDNNTQIALGRHNSSIINDIDIYNYLTVSLTNLGIDNLTIEQMDYYYNIYQLMLQNESTDDIEFIQMLTDYAVEFNVTYEQMESYYQNYYDNAYFNNQSVDISLEDYNFIEQGSGVIEAIYTPIVNMIDTITTISDRVTKFFGIKEQTTINYYDYSTLYEEFELNQIFGRKIYTYDISTTQQIQYSLDLNSYRLVTYYMILGVRVWEINTEVLTYARLDELNEIYEWIDVA
jgi:hypothetical protein